MANNGADHMINIQVRIFEGQTFWLQVHQQIPVPMLRGHIAMVTGILEQNQRLLHNGRLLSDEHPLSRYNVQDGHNIHLVIQRPDVPFQRMPYQPGPVPFQGVGNTSFAMGGPVPDGDSELARRIITSVVEDVVFGPQTIPSDDVPDAMTTLHRELYTLNRLYETNGNQNPHQQMDWTPGSLIYLYWAARPLLNNLLSRMHMLESAIQMQMYVQDVMERWSIQRLAWTLGTQLQDVGTFLLELGRITNTPQVSPTNYQPPRVELISGPAVYIDPFYHGSRLVPRRYFSRPGTSGGAGAGAGVRPNTGPNNSSTGNQVREPIPDLNLDASEDQAADDGRS